MISGGLLRRVVIRGSEAARADDEEAVIVVVVVALVGLCVSYFRLTAAERAGFKRERHGYQYLPSTALIVSKISL